MNTGNERRRVPEVTKVAMEGQKSGRGSLLNTHQTSQREEEQPEPISSC